MSESTPEPDKNDKKKQDEWAKRLGLDDEVLALFAAAMEVEQRSNPPPLADLPDQDWRPGLKLKGEK